MTNEERPALSAKARREAIDTLFDYDERIEIVRALTLRSNWLSKRVNAGKGQGLTCHEEQRHLNLIEGTHDHVGLISLLNPKAVATTQELSKDVEAPPFQAGDKLRIEGDDTKLYLTEVRDIPDADKGNVPVLVIEDEEGEPVGWTDTSQVNWSWEESLWVAAAVVPGECPEAIEQQPETTEAEDANGEDEEAPAGDEPQEELAAPAEREEEAQPNEEVSEGAEESASGEQPASAPAPVEPAADTAPVVGQKFKYAGEAFRIAEVADGQIKLVTEKDEPVATPLPIQSLKWHGGWSCWLYAGDAEIELGAI